MRLKSIELAGFKSFVDPTRIELGPGITAIVGPNGCGKSNIVDALRWVLGEHSARHLRGGVMDDLIFQGSETRAPVAVCDVELTFAVDPGSLPPPYHEVDEIRIRRRLTREGGSDAFINGKMVRIKDVVDLFLDTGVSTRAYAIVEQGAIARMVTARPDERRQIFEEAAGVMKYRARRRETERRMRDTAQNLERVRDLLDEVRKQCRSLKQQAARAERFRSLQDEHARMQAVLFALRHREMTAQMEEIRARLRQAVQREESAKSELSRCEQAVHAAKERWIAHEAQAQAMQDQLREAERQRATLQRKAERLAGERRLLHARKQAIAERLEETRRRMRELDEELDALNGQLATQNDQKLLQQRREADEQVRQARAEYAEAQQAHRQLLGEYERLRHAEAHARQQRQKAEESTARLQERMDRLHARRQQLERDCAANEAEMHAARQRLQQLTAEQQNHAEQQVSLSRQLEAAKAQHEVARCRLRESERQLRRLRGEVEELAARLEHGDVPSALRERLRARGGLWMDETLDVPTGLEAAVAAALRGRSADLALPIAGAAELLAELKEAPVAVFSRPGRVDVRLEASLASALGLEADHPLYDLFSAIALVDDIRGALGRDEQCVSLDGWRYEPLGWLVPPSGNRTARRLALQRQLRARRRHLEQQQREQENAEAAMHRAEQELEDIRKRWEDARHRALDLENRRKTAEAALARLQQQLDAGRQRRAQLDEDLQETARELAHWRRLQQEDAGVDSAAVDAAREQLERQQQRLRELEQRLHEGQQRHAQAEQALALFRQSMESLRRQQQRLQQERQRLAERCRRDRSEMEQAKERVAALEKDDGLDTRLREAERQVERAHRALNEIRRQGHELQQQQHECEQNERECRKRLQACAEARQRIALEQAEANAHLQELEAEIAQRFQTNGAGLLGRVDREDWALPDVERRCTELEDRLQRFGPVNLLAIDEYEQAREREAFLDEQAGDLEASLATLRDTISRIDRTMRDRFREVFEQTNAIFRQTFPRLFGGGRAELRLDSGDILHAGVEVIAQPPGKRLQDIGLLSGGEKALTAVALVFSIFQIKPAPFCVLDEVDAPLDDANVGRFGAMIRELADRVQFLAITHNKITMQHADRLVGVSMPEAGVSRIVGVELEEG